MLDTVTVASDAIQHVATCAQIKPSCGFNATFGPPQCAKSTGNNVPNASQLGHRRSRRMIVQTAVRIFSQSAARDPSNIWYGARSLGQQRPGSSLQINGEDKCVYIPVLLSALFVLAGPAIAARESIFETVRRGMCLRPTMPSSTPRILAALPSMAEEHEPGSSRTPDQQNETVLDISDEAFKLHLEDSDSIEEHLHILMADNMEDFPEDDSSDQAALFAARIAKACIIDKTRSGHVRQDPDLLFKVFPTDTDSVYRIIKTYLRYHLRQNSAWKPKEVSAQTPRDINMFITQKCGPVKE
ncbi:hypothetical protein B0H17DRAFT_1128880 [Mycena rosella]|uniref:Uncharacterized protein n=1 Tax=Mycena rosella TaxID=1033263 RepID=A0AAD7GLM6_MYCRO|nr:hypothetical protein B0H17DRAFT_1128880 [Mycena rosella]